MYKIKAKSLTAKLSLLTFLLFLLAAATVVSPKAISCTDMDSDGTCAPADCDDHDRSRSMQDVDGDGVTSCAGDCADYDPTINYCDGYSDSYIAPPDYTQDPSGGMTCTVKNYTVLKYKCTTSPAGQTTCELIDSLTTEVERTCSY